MQNESLTGNFEKLQVEEVKIIVSMLGKEFQNIEKILTEERLKPKVKHELKFPYRTITLNIKSVRDCLRN